MNTEAMIVGMGETDLGKVPDRTLLGLHVDAAALAMDDAGVTKDEIDGLICIDPFLAETPRFHISLAEHLGLYAKTMCDSLMMGGASPGHGLQIAKWAVESGLCKAVMLIGAESLLSGSGGQTAGGVEAYVKGGAHSLEFEVPYGGHIPAFYALLAQRYMHEYSLTEAQLAQIAVTTRRHAGHNDKAQMREPITVDDVLSSSPVALPLRKLDCSLISDGGAAVIVTSADRAKDLRHPPLAMLGLGQGHSAYHMGHLATGGDGFDLTHTVCRLAGERAFGQAGLTPADIDVAEIYDSFTITVLAQLEDLGFCQKGEGGRFVEDGGLELTGQLPTNTHGGLLSCAHPGVPGGMLHVTEAIRQLRGAAGSRQIPDAETALVTSASAVASNFAVSILAKT